MKTGTFKKDISGTTALKSKDNHESDVEALDDDSTSRAPEDADSVSTGAGLIILRPPKQSNTDPHTAEAFKVGITTCSCRENEQKYASTVFPMTHFHDHAGLPVINALCLLCRATARTWDESLFRCSRLLLCRLEHSFCRGTGAGRSVQAPVHRRHLAQITRNSSKG